MPHLETDSHAPKQWLASPDKLPTKPIERMTVIFDNPKHVEQEEKYENPEKTNKQKPHKKKRKQNKTMINKKQ